MEISNWKEDFGQFQSLVSFQDPATVERFSKIIGTPLIDRSPSIKAFIEQTHLALLNELKEEVEAKLSAAQIVYNGIALETEEGSIVALRDIRSFITSRIAALSEKQKEGLADNQN